ncbi:MAG: hypothetical protein CMM84_19140 [Rhodothermaceae bacterium]|nr:hypothetical protein [Rhodothermaceae bacterium]MBC13122.1 hypothetical protein [Rhodothermaceae bacterium]
MGSDSTGFKTQQQAAVDVPRWLHDWTGLKVHVEEEAERGEAHVDLAGALGSVPFVVEVKADGGVATVQRALDGLEAVVDAVRIVVVPFMSPAGRERCEASGVSWIDLSGNARVRIQRGDLRVAVHIEGKPDAFRGPGRPRNAFAPKAARVVRLLLADPARRWTQSDIARAADLGPGYVSRIVRHLEDERLLDRDDDRAVWPPDPGLLLDAWADADAFRHEVLTGHVPGRSGEERARRLQDALADHGLGHAFTGLAAAWAYTHAAAFRSVSCYVTGAAAARSRALADAGFRADTSAPNTRVLLPADGGVFDGARTASGLECVSPVQAVVDLAHEPERAAEFREALRERSLPWSPNSSAS